ncbi:MAG: alpha-amylase family glycosyl hydrolase, partial [Ardenticatenaceae bacterium]
MIWGLMMLGVVLLLLAACRRGGEETNGVGAAPTGVAGVTQPVEAPTMTPAPTETVEVARAGEPVSPISLPPEGTDDFPWWNDTVWYEIFVRSFYDSDGDGIGDLQGLIRKLDYLNDGDPTTTTDLGVTGIWLMPIMESPSYHGYDVMDYYSVEEDYGTEEDFKQLMEEAHARGIRVIVDMVLNHTSRDHPWFEAALAGDPQYEAWYRFVEGEQPRQFAPWGGPNIWRPAGGDRYYYALYWEGMPDLNYASPEVTEEMQNVVRFWLEEMGVDGFRLDGIAHLVEQERQVKNTEGTHEWLATFHPFVQEVDPQAALVGEVWYPTNEIVPYIVEDQLDLAFEFNTATGILAAVEGENAGPARIAYGLNSNLYPPLQYAPFLSNHDQNRIFSELDQDMNHARMAAAILLTGPGSPFLYYGEEVAMTGAKPDENIRRPFPWSGEENGGFTAARPWHPLPDGYEINNVAAMNDDPGS